jgi:L-alanine-DL-glutamate epimerase-like enolase superfamily enzyme
MGSAGSAIKLESEDERRTVKQAVRHGYRVFKLNFIGQRGPPDRLFGRDGRSVLIEFKRLNETPTLQQLKRHNELRQVFGLEVAWTDRYEEACEILGIPTGF